MRVFLGSYTSAGGRGIGVGAFDDGRLTVHTWSDVVADPSWLALSPDGSTLYAVIERDPDGMVSALELPGLALRNAAPCGASPAHLALDPLARHLVAALYGGGALAVHPLLPGGGVASPVLTEHVPDAGQRDPHAHQTVFDPSGRWALVTDLGLDTVFVYEFASGELMERSRLRLPDGTGPRHLVFGPDGGRVFVVGELDSTVTTCVWRDGELDVLSRVGTRPASASGENSAAGIAVAPDGRFLYVGNRGDDTTAVLAVTPEGAELVATHSCGGVWPRHTCLDPSGRWLFSANERSGEVVWFELDAGLPAREAGRIAAPAVSHVLFG